MDVRDAVSGLRPQPKGKGKGNGKKNSADPTLSFDDFTNDDGTYVAVQYRGNVVLPLVVSQSDMKRIEDAMQS